MGWYWALTGHRIEAAVVHAPDHHHIGEESTYFRQLVQWPWGQAGGERPPQRLWTLQQLPQLPELEESSPTADLEAPCPPQDSGADTLAVPTGGNPLTPQSLFILEWDQISQHALDCQLL